MAVQNENRKTFRVALIKPSHYDDDGYVIRWHRTVVPSNTLAVLYGLSQDLAERKVLGEDVDIVVDGYDETNTKIPIDQIIRDIKNSDGGGFVGFIGVQTNQFPRSIDMASRFRDAGLQVCIGGFHVSGCLALLSKIPPDIQHALDIGISLFIGESESKLDVVFKDAYAGKMKPMYNYLAELPAIESTPPPFLPAKMLERAIGSISSLDAGRGCPFLCSFCSIINVQGNKSRRRTADDIEEIVRVNAAQGITRFFITDDNFARNKNWEEIFDRLIWLREEQGMNIRLTLQVDTMCHKIRNFIDKAAKSGVSRVFIGMESINPDTLKAARKKQNRISEYRKMFHAWHKANIITCAGFIVGFPGDTPESVMRDIETIKRELPIDFLQLSFLTPLPGSMDHKHLYEKGEWMDQDMNKYDLNHIVSHHPTMSREVWEKTFWDAWNSFYSEEHIETVFKRARADGMSVGKALFLMLWFYSCIKYEHLHPFEAGFFRRKSRHERRPGLPLENPLIFYPKRLWQVVSTHVKVLLLLNRWGAMRRRIKSDPNAANYTDISLTPLQEE
jgi:radical SAM superfamily enzyme YgiQ (UPF0313 family)